MANKSKKGVLFSVMARVGNHWSIFSHNNKGSALEETQKAKGKGADETMVFTQARRHEGGAGLCRTCSDTLNAAIKAWSS